MRIEIDWKRTARRPQLPERCLPRTPLVQRAVRFVHHSVADSHKPTRLSAPQDGPLVGPETRSNRGSGHETLCGGQCAANDRWGDRMTIAESPANLTQRESLAVQGEHF